MPKIVDKASKRKEIAKKAMELFAKSGFESTPIREITKRAGIGKGTFYDYFTDKEDILNEIVQLIFAEWTEFMIAKTSHIDDPLEQLQSLLKEGTKLGDSFEQLMIIYVDMWRWSVSSKGSLEFTDKFKKLLGELKQAVVRIIESAQEKGSVKKTIDASVFATTLIALIDGLCLHHMILKSEFDVDTISRNYFEMLLNGIKP